MEELYFLGVYSGNPPKADSSPLDKPTLWNVYLKKDKKIYIVQRLDENNQATAEQYKLSPAYFGINFRQVKNAPLKQNINSRLKLLDTDTDKHESFFASFFKNHSALNSIFQQQNNQKKSNEFAFQLGDASAAPVKQKETSDNTLVQSLGKRQTNEFQFNVSDQAPAKNKNDEENAPYVKSLEKKQTNEFQFNVSDKISQKNVNSDDKNSAYIHDGKALPKELQINVSAPKDSQGTTPTVRADDKKYNYFNKETDQHPFDEKYNPERFGLTTILNSLNDPKKNPQKSPEQNSFGNGNAYGLRSKQINADTTLVSHKAEDSKTQIHTIDGDNAFFDNLFNDENIKQPSVPQTPQTAVPQNDSELLPAKGNTNALSRSEKALKLDTSMRKDFQVSMHHWNMAKKNLAMRHFRDIIYREANFVPAHKHMFTDFAIQLRKINQHDLALVAAVRCTKLSPDDSHAFFNVARLYYELGRYENANEFIDKTLLLEPDLAPAVRLSAIIKECLRRKAINK